MEHLARAIKFIQCAMAEIELEGVSLVISLSTSKFYFALLACDLQSQSLHGKP